MWITKGEGKYFMFRLYANQFVVAHFHFYMIYKLKNEMVHIINCLDSSVGRAIGSDPEG